MRECYWCMGPGLKRPHAAGCPAERGVPASHRPTEVRLDFAGLAGVDEVPDEVTVPTLDRYRAEAPLIPAYLRRAGVL